MSSQPRHKASKSLHSNRWKAFLVLSSLKTYAPINGMPHLAYLGRMLDKGGVGISWDCPNPLNPLKWHTHFRVKNHWKTRNPWTPISSCRTLCMTGVCTLWTVTDIVFNADILPTWEFFDLSERQDSPASLTLSVQQCQLHIEYCKHRCCPQSSSRICSMKER